MSSPLTFPDSSSAKIRAQSLALPTLKAITGLVVGFDVILGRVHGKRY